MKCITFDNEKGGVGKTTFSIMYASWLKYKHGINVAVGDFNERIMAYRKREKKEKLQNGSWSDEMETNAWKIAAPSTREDIDYIIKYNSINENGYARWMAKQINEKVLGNPDVLILDFPGSWRSGEYVQFLTDRWIGLTIIPVDKDIQAIQSTMKLCLTLNKRIHHNNAVFINRINLGDKKENYAKIKDVLMKSGIRVLPDMVSFSNRITKIEESSIIRSTYGFPDWNDKAFSGSRDLGIENLFIDITRELAKTPEIPGTPEVALKFIESLEKERNDARQLNGTSFPEYEMKTLY